MDEVIAGHLRLNVSGGELPQEGYDPRRLAPPSSRL